jgi:rsbT co-antagonist protein RsbR
METDKKITVGGVELSWDLDSGKVLFEGGDVVLFWVSAMKTFFDTIREISGDEATNLVLETTGFRQGLIVGEVFRKMEKNITLSNVVDWLSNTYAPAGWGKVEIQMDTERDTFILHIKDDWEYKMNQIDQKNTNGNFVSAHYAGVFTGLSGRNYWFRTIQTQDSVNPYSIIEYFPSTINVTQNIHELSRKQEAERIQQLEHLVNEKTNKLQKLVKELSSPIIPVLEGILVVPMIGSYDEDRAEDLIVNTLTKLPEYKAHFLLLDLTGLTKDITQHTAATINKLGSAAKLLGTEMILVGVSAELAVLITNSLTSLGKYECLQTLRHGIYYALGKSGRQIV